MAEPHAGVSTNNRLRFARRRCVFALRNEAKLGEKEKEQRAVMCLFLSREHVKANRDTFMQVAKVKSSELVRNQRPSPSDCSIAALSRDLVNINSVKNELEISNLSKTLVTAQPPYQTASTE